MHCCDFSGLSLIYELIYAVNHHRVGANKTFNRLDHTYNGYEPRKGMTYIIPGVIEQTASPDRFSRVFTVM